MRLWTGQTVSQFGSTVTREALPYTAILVLHATPLQMGLLGAAGSAPLLLIGLLAGVWVDRLRRRPLMIAADLGRALLLLSVPAAYLLGWLGIAQLYVVAALAGVLTVFFDVAYTALLPSLIEREHLLEGNSKLGVSGALAEIAGPSTGGALVQLISAPMALFLDALSFLFSALTLARIRAVEQPPPRHGARMRVRDDLATGLRMVCADPLLRVMAGGTVISSFFGWFFGAIYGLYALDELGMSPAVLGLTVACGGIGALLGSLLAGPAARRFGVGAAIVGALLISASAHSLIWLAGGLPAAAVALMVASQLLGDSARSVAMINQMSLRQTITPDRLLGRVNACMEVLGQGIGTLGMLVGGVLGTAMGLRPTVAIAVLGLLAGAIWVLCSPLRRLRAWPVRTEER